MTVDKPRTDTRKAKKSETLEVRLPHETKQAFLTACREDGTTASEVVRESIDSYLDERGRPASQPATGKVLAMIPKPLRNPKVALGAAGAVGLAVFVALPSAAAPDFKSQFNRLDTNKDGVISLEEFADPQGRAAGAAKTTSDNNVSIMMQTHIGERGSAPDVPAAATTSSSSDDAYTFWLPDVDGQAGGANAAETQFNVIQRSEIRITDDGGKDAKAGDAPSGNVKRSFKMCTQKQGEDKPTCTESGSLPSNMPAMASFNVKDIRKSEFKSYDKDGDGKVSFAEYQARQTAMLTRGFEILDANGDKALSQDEYSRIANPPMPAKANDAVNSALAASGVTIVSKYTPQVLQAAFTRLDRNADGRLTLQEYLPPS